MISIWVTHEGGMSKLFSSSSLACEERRWGLARALEAIVQLCPFPRPSLAKGAVSFPGRARNRDSDQDGAEDESSWADPHSLLAWSKMVVPPAAIMAAQRGDPYL